ncbi:hypothetical protein ABLA30_07055 [Xenorhabdus nematophila]|uniref:hypothetical protein n=1 Tax=Xenorhabdus nematophila TaxID=628 RepID=UPI0032B78416
MKKKDSYFQEIEFLRRLHWQSESIQALSDQISKRILRSQNPVLIGMSCLFILLKEFRDEGHPSDLLYKYEVVVGKVIEEFNFNIAFTQKLR